MYMYLYGILTYNHISTYILRSSFIYNKSMRFSLRNPRQEHSLNWRACDQYKAGQPRNFVASRWPVNMRLFVVPEIAE